MKFGQLIDYDMKLQITCPYLIKIFFKKQKTRSLEVSYLRSETKGFPVRVRLLAMCRGELST